MTTETEIRLVCDALVLMRRNIEEQYDHAIANLPRHGKGVATVDDDDDEQDIIRRVKSIDTLIDNYQKGTASLDSVSKPKQPKTSQARSLSTVTTEPPKISAPDYEPYINPFTGEWIIPESPGNPGPSGTTRDASSSVGYWTEAINSTEQDTKARRLFTTPAVQSLGVESRRPFDSADETFQPVSCDALWDVFGEISQEQTHSPGASTPRNPLQEVLGQDLDVSKPMSIEPIGVTDADREDIERCLQEFENQLNLKGWARPTLHPEVTVQDQPPLTPRFTPKAALSQSPIPQKDIKAESNNEVVVLAPKDISLLPIRQDITSEVSNDVAVFSTKDLTVPPIQRDVPSEVSNHVIVFDPEDITLPPIQRDTDAWDLYVFDDSHSELDRRKALELAQDIPQDFGQLYKSQQAAWQQERAQLEAIQDEINAQEERDLEATLAEIRRLQDEWNREADQILLQEQEMARKIAEQEDVKDHAATMLEIRRMQEEMQAEDDRRFQEDFRLALQLAEMDGAEMDDATTSTALRPPISHEPPPYTETRVPGAWPDENPALVQRPTRSQNSLRQHQTLAAAATPDPAPSNSTTLESGPSVRRTSPQRQRGSQKTTLTKRHRAPAPIPTHESSQSKSSLTAADRDNISASLNAANNLQKSWETELRKNEAAAQAARREIQRLDRQAREESERLRQEEEQRRIAEEKRQEAERKARLAREADCSVCSESLLKEQMCRLTCKHYYCRGCLLQSIQTALKDRKAFRCCKTQATPDILGPFLPPEILAHYTALTEELATPNPTYCHIKKCSAFIPPTHYTADNARCPRCAYETCRLCKSALHPGTICKQDVAGQALISLGNKKKWIQCPHCRTMVEKRSGCLHMSCTCGTSFCYNCGRSGCGGENCKRR